MRMTTQVSQRSLILVSLVSISLLPAVSVAQTNNFDRIIGKWIGDDEGYQIIIEDDGSVFTQGSDFPLSGSSGGCVDAGANFCFEGRYSGKRFRCSYRISFPKGRDTLRFRTTSATFRGCPDGLFTRSDD